MRTITTLALTSLMLAQLTPTEAQAALSSSEWAKARQTKVDQTYTFSTLPLDTKREGAVRMKRIDVYAADAKILVPEGDGYRELPRSDWLHFVADRNQDALDLAIAPRLGISIAPDGSSSYGLLFGEDGKTYSITSESRANALEFKLRKTSEDTEGNPVGFTCLNDLVPNMAVVASDQPSHDEPLQRAVTAASRSGVVAIDTDNEFMQLKFSDNTTNATNYLAQLFVGFNVIYERDLDLTVLQGTTILRTSGVADPYSQSNINNQLTELGTVWVATQAATSRAFAMLLSGKASDPFGASGLAFILNTSNYCGQTAASGGHYSVTQVFKFAGSNASHDLPVVAHELGHNFGAFHSHCSSAIDGTGPTPNNTIDTCFNSDTGCFAGTRVCPMPATVNGVANVRGTLMSYCNPFLSGLPGCTDSNVFANAHRMLLTPRVANNVNSGCFTNTSAVNSAPTLNVINNPAGILEDAGQQTVNLSGIGDGDGSTQTLTVTASSNNTGLIPNPTVTYSSPASTGSIRYTPVANQFGTAVVTVTVTDNGGTSGGGVNTFSRNFTVTVTGVNDAPTLDVISSPSPLPLNAGQRVINLAGITRGPGDPAQTLTVTAVSNMTGVIPNPSVNYSSPNSTGSISYTPVAGQQGSVMITVTVTDNGGTANGGANSVQRSFTQVIDSNMIFANGFE